jgi:biotin operon repressor/anti-sigma regulatory factor (Ser/Thr protein kinase)
VDARAKILQALKKSGPLSGARIAAVLGMSRQAAHRHLLRLLEEGAIRRSGRTRGLLYALPRGQDLAATGKEKLYRRTFPLDGLREDVVFTDVELRLDLKRALSVLAYRIFAYAFTEMLNNAVEHSGSPTCRVDVTLAEREVRAVVRDQGVGVFASIARYHRLDDEDRAIGELLKGKATSLPERHAGEGIFFTSKACDTFALRSHGLELVVDNRRKDVFVNVRAPLRGTEVTLSISRAARRKLEEVFNAFAPADFDFKFERSQILVRFYAGQYVARSEARRLLARLDGFREVVLDFSGVKSLGQGFADEVFRVFAAAHPEITLKTVNVAPGIDAVIRHVVEQ